MNNSSRFVVAVHIMSVLDIAPSYKQLSSVPSDKIALSVNTNSVVVRRLLGHLRKAGLVNSQAGAHGGSMLAKPSNKITLLDIYQAVDDGRLFPLHPSTPNLKCPIGRNIQEVLGSTLNEAEQAMEHELARVTLAQISDDIMHKADIVRVLA